MKHRGHIDRTKHEVDIAERVLEGGVWAGPGQFEGTLVVDFDIGVQPWSLGTAVSVVQKPIVPKDRDKG